MTPKPLSPGDPAAMWRGCTCPMVENYYGRGFRVDNDGPPVYIVAEGCPMHDEDEKWGKVPECPAS